MHDIHIIGGGLAGSEAAWQLAEAGFKVRLSEMRGVEGTAAHHSDNLAELVCSNSFRSDDPEKNAVGLLHAEMRALGSLILAQGDAHRVPAGSALAMDRDGFAEGVTAAIVAHPNIELVRERIDTLPDGPAIVATGPLTAPASRSRSSPRRGRTSSPSSMRSRRSSTATASTWTSAGSSRAGTRATGTTTSTAR